VAVFLGIWHGVSAADWRAVARSSTGRQTRAAHAAAVRRRRTSRGWLTCRIVRQRRRRCGHNSNDQKLPTAIGALMYAAIAAAGPTDQASGGAMLGFSAAHSLDEQATERLFDADLNAGELREWMRTMASEPNQVGSVHDKANAEFMLQKFREWGWDASIETFSVLYPTPRHIALQLIAPKRYTARLAEPAIKQMRARATAPAYCRRTTSMAPTAMSAPSWCTSLRHAR